MLSTPVSNDPEALLDVRGLSVAFGHVPVVMGVDLSVGAQETLCLVGESGSGKSVTSLSLMGLAPSGAQITGGRVMFEGAELTAMSTAQLGKLRGRRMAMVFQNPAHSLNPILTIGKQLGEIYAWHSGAGRGETRDRVSHLLRQVGITDASSRLGQFPHELSGGMKQRVCIARALLCDPALILADEPTTNLDVTIQAQILDLLDEIKETFRTSILLVTHDMGVVARMADRISVMYAGRICESGTVRAVFRDPQHPYTRALLGSTPRIDTRYAPGSRDLPAIGGRPPNPAQRPGGCQFHPRCAEAMPDCAARLPRMSASGPGHAVSCLRRGSQIEEDAA
ncbi:ABC transporter ATP-binding protein [Salipiger sp. 1_MG-2023]|uniref:ABC transporter ATP-binding protein n=1 Tax=Salipiger sp. 1_MG-2023 TaxID=3062665 RepID=UPI0026E35661|nr:ABC transporter ATP-binding protein [Salipiger sp. 1_MG-2023]MDO6585695.1 ABC transporter ATP-binding protein [Salipiger sp. 1_MG-2023]